MNNYGSINLKMNDRNYFSGINNNNQTQQLTIFQMLDLALNNSS